MLQTLNRSHWLRTPLPLRQLQIRGYNNASIGWSMQHAYSIPRKLTEVVKLPLFQREDPTKIRELWLEHFKDHLAVVAGCLARPEYLELKANAKECPVFICPVRKLSGYMNLVMQFQDNQILFTALHEYQQKGNDAALYAVITLFDDFVMNKDVALLRAEVVAPELTKKDCIHLVRYVREFYGGQTDKFKWVKDFNHRAHEFDYESFQEANRTYFKD
eukprot:gene295-1060_t